jgi:ABC-type transporter Mla subunit MlaD
VRFLLAFVLAALALGASGCGGDGGGNDVEGASPDQWSGDICTAVADWAQDLQTRAGQPPKSTRTIADVREQLVDFIGDVVTRTDRMLTDVEAAGQPSVEDGDKIARDLQARLQSLRTTLVRAKQKVQGLPDDPSKFGPAAQDLGASIQKAGSDIGDQIDQLDEKYDAEELSKSFNDNPRCSDLAREGS